jgi:ferredoxin hydrogenase small subunit
MKAAGLTCGYALLGFRTAKESVASVLDLVGLRQQSVYKTEADGRIYKLRKSQDNPMVKKLYAKDGFLPDGPCGHHSHELLHTHYKDKSMFIKALKKKGVELAM